MNHELDPQAVLTNLSYLYQTGKIQKEQILAVVNSSPQQSETKPKSSHSLSIQQVLYYVGGFIVLLGIIIFFAQFWSDMDPFSKTLLTSGSAVATYALGYYFYQVAKHSDLGHAFFFISVVLFPLATDTVLRMITGGETNSATITVSAAVLFLIYFVTYYAIKAEIFLPFAIIAASVMFFSSTNYLVRNVGTFKHFDEYRLLVIGISYLLLGYYLASRGKHTITTLLYFFGLLFMLGTTFSLQGFKPNISFFWSVAFPPLVFLVYYASIKLENKIFLLFATLFTFFEIIKFSYEYFSNTLGWPVSLMLAGLAMMACGYISFELNKRYLKRTAPVSHN